MSARLSIAFLIVCLLACKSERKTPRGIGEGIVGPSTVGIRSDLNPKSNVITTVRHGDRLIILETRRRFIRVRTPGGVEGWTDSKQLMAPEQVSDLERLAESSAKLPSQGLATVFEPLNVHAEPSRTSISFYQIPEGSKIDVVAHRITPRNAAPATPAPPAPKPRVARRKKREKEGRLSLPEPPPAPKPPKNWLELSQAVKPQKPAQPAKPAAPPAPVPMDDWSLVRTKDGKAGWVLSRMVNMAIPDEVAQYAEGHRITSYFKLGEMHDGDLVKPNWLWTTVNKGPVPYEFDSFRVFFWSRGHHRYETQYIERNVEGYYPIEVAPGTAPSFTLILREEDGKLYRKTWQFEAYRFRLVKKEPYEPGAHRKSSAPLAAAAGASGNPGGSVPPSWFARFKAKLRGAFGKK